MSILFVSGVNDRSELAIQVQENGSIAPVVDGSCAVRGHLHGLRESSDFVLLFGTRVRQAGVKLPAKPRLIFNQISDADSHRGALRRCIQLCQHAQVPVINHPLSVQATTRDGVADRLQGIAGVRMPRTIRFRPGSPDDVLGHADGVGIKPPYIVRVAGDHNGRSMVRVSDPSDSRDLHALPFDGRDFYLTEYVDYRGGDGYYHKHRIAVIDGEPILRHALFNDAWLVHAESRSLMSERETWDDYFERTDEIERRLQGEGLRQAITEIARRLGLDYFGIDANVGEDETLLIFEANANMNLLHNRYPQLDDLVDRIRARIQALLERRLGQA